ncbi:speckle-type POZ protein B [Nasonia vitripennis]|uniref:BTB domain-containing protein n=1 Tax=Nasonia vitripennis TaxID=7425 RepID=A0A7M7QD85_NASVI|nr:speckle-type POZ protein B [Nasonia vitripennis]
MNDKEYCDMSFLVDGKTFKAHKCILAKESPVFDAMFKIDMKEKLLNEVIIEDIRPDIFEKLLRYMYVGEVEDIQAIAVELLVAADKYAIDELKLKCGQSLIDNLSIDSAVESLVITDRYNMNLFKATVIQFITSHSAGIVVTPSFKLLTAIPHVLYEVCLAVGMKK